jgi:hypothetical protein
MSEPTSPAAEPEGAASLDDGMRRAVIGVAASGLFLCLVGGAFGGGRFAVGTLSGAVVAALNLLVFVRLGRALIESRAKGWVLVALFKMIALFAGAFWLFREGVVDTLPFVLGYGAMPLGITLAQLTAKAHDAPSPTDGHA